MVQGAEEPNVMTPIIGNFSPVWRAQERSRSVSSLMTACKGGRNTKDVGKRASFLSDSMMQAVTCGVVNGILLPPVMVSFVAIIFQDPAFTSFLPRLVKLLMFSGAVHAATIATLSDLKFAVGSVQDAGLIFLSTIASSVAAYAKDHQLDSKTLMSNACVVLCSCTALLGLSLVFLGRLRLAGVVQYLPMPVIGGYLAFIGYFCGQAGLAFATGLEITSIATLSELASREALTLVSPALAGGVVMYLLVRRFPSPGTLPLVMVTFVAGFFAILRFTGTTLEEARSLGWVGSASPMLPLHEAWGYFDLRNVHWDLLVRVFPTQVVMTLVVAFSSCLDVAAIEMEMGTPLDFNRELQTVGWSNVISGLTGGFTGSYIFSLTIFNLRAGVDSRVSGMITSVLILAVAASPWSVISYLPRAFFGAMLVFIAVDLMVEWLWEARRRMMPAEYAICLATFAMIHAVGVAAGMFAGLVLAALSFTITYAQTPKVMKARVRSSNVMRTFEERVILQAHSQQTVVLELQGYIFFGSAVKMLSDVKKRVVWGGGDPEGMDGSDLSCSGDGKARHGQLPKLSLASHGTPSVDAGTGPSLGDQMPNGTLSSSRSQHQRSATMGDILGPVFSRAGSMRGSLKVSEVGRGTSWSSAWANRGGKTGEGQFERVFGKRKAVAGPGIGLGEASRAEQSCLPDAVIRPVDASESGVSSRVRSRMSSERHGGQLSGVRSVDTDADYESVLESEGIDYGALEGGVAERGVGTNGTEMGTETNEVFLRPRMGSCMGNGEGRTRADQSASAVYMSLWSTAPAEEGHVQSFRQQSMSQLPPSEQRTRRVILDFTTVVGIDATSARSCFLMLKIVLQKSGVGVVFAGARKSILDLLRAHGVIGDEDPSFESLDMALEWAEEMTLNERRDTVLQEARRQDRDQDAPPPSPRTPSLEASRVSQGPGDESTQGVTPFQSKGEHRRVSSSSSTARAPLPLSAVDPVDNSDAEQPVPSVLPSEATAFLGENEEYYARAGLQRRKSFGFQIADDVLQESLGHGSLKSILEDYLELDRHETSGNVQLALEDARRFFKTRHVTAGEVLIEEGTASDKLHFIGSGSVELEVPGETQGRRILKACTGGTFGAMGFYLQTPQPFRAVAIEDCHLYTLDREHMAMMQRQNSMLCILVQKALLKSICLTASMSLETKHLLEVDDRRPPRFRCFMG